MKSDLPHIRPIHAVFCDDIRKEVTGKEILIGVYSGDLLVPHLPAPVVLAIWVPFERIEGKSGKIPIEFRLLDDNNRPIGYGSAEIEVSDTADTGSLSFPSLGAMLDHSGRLVFQLKQYDDSWQTIASLKVGIRPAPVNASASAPSLPSSRSEPAPQKPTLSRAPSRPGSRVRPRRS